MHVAPQAAIYDKREKVAGKMIKEGVAELLSYIIRETLLCLQDGAIHCKLKSSSFSQLDVTSMESGRTRRRRNLHLLERSSFLIPRSAILSCESQSCHKLAIAGLLDL